MPNPPPVLVQEKLLLWEPSSGGLHFPGDTKMYPLQVEMLAKKSGTCIRGDLEAELYALVQPL